MAWESRSGLQYFYRSYRTPDGRVRKEYFGNGARAECAAARDAERQREKRRDEEAIVAFCVEVSDADLLLTSFGQRCSLLLEATLVANGYHKHRGEWRRRGCQGRPKKTRV